MVKNINMKTNKREDNTYSGVVASFGTSAWSLTFEEVEISGVSSGLQDREKVRLQWFVQPSNGKHNFVGEKRAITAADAHTLLALANMEKK
jgi:hypothetical protein